MVALARIRIPPGEPEIASPRSFVTDMGDGIRYAVTHPGIGTLFVLLIAIGVGGRPLTELLPGFADDVFHAGASGLSILASAVGAGAILGGVWLGHRAHSSDLMAVTLAMTLGQALTAIAIIATDRLWLAVPAVVAYGFWYVQRRHREPDPGPARQRPQHARARDGALRPDLPRRTRRSARSAPASFPCISGCAGRWSSARCCWPPPGCGPT